MQEDAFQLRRRELELVLPQVAVFHVAVFAHLEVVGQDRERAGVAADQPLDGKGEAVRLVGGGRGVDRVGEKPRALVLVARIDPQQRVAVHRRRVVQIRRGEDERQALRIQRRVPFAKARASAQWQAAAVEPQLLVEPSAPCDEGALGILPLGRLLDVGEEAGERRFELGLRPGLALGRVVEAAVVEQAVQPGADQVGLVVHELAPLGTLGEPELARARDQRREVGVIGAERGERREQRDENQRPDRHEKKPCGLPQGFRYCR